MNEQILNLMTQMISEIRTDMNTLLQAQQINNFLALSNNLQVPENIRQEALNKALGMMGLQQSKAAEQFAENALPNDIIR